MKTIQKVSIPVAVMKLFVIRSVAMLRTSAFTSAVTVCCCCGEARTGASLDRGATVELRLAPLEQPLRASCIAIVMRSGGGADECVY
jgi:hypothetical protein